MGGRRTRSFFFIFLHFTSLAFVHVVSFPPYIFKSANFLMSSLTSLDNSKHSHTIWNNCYVSWSFSSFSNTDLFLLQWKPEVWSYLVIKWNGISRFAILLETRWVYLNRVFLLLMKNDWVNRVPHKQPGHTRQYLHYLWLLSHYKTLPTSHMLLKSSGQLQLAGKQSRYPLFHKW